MTPPWHMACALLCIQLVAAWSLGPRTHKRDDSVFVPKRVNIPLTYDDSGRYVTTVTMNPGSTQQQFQFTLTTSTALTYVASVECTNCTDATTYNRTRSTDAQSLSSSATSAPLFGQPAAASFVKEDCQLTIQNGSAWDYPNQTIVIVGGADDSSVAVSSNAQVGKGLSGMIGLGTAKQITSSINSSVFMPQFADSPFGQWLAQHPTALNFSFGMALNQPRDAQRGNDTSAANVSGESDEAGILHWLQPDSSAYVPSQLVWKTVNNSISTQLPVSGNATSGADWFVDMDGWVMTAGTNHLSNTQGFIASVDPLYPAIYLPASQAKLIHDAIPGSQLRSDLSSLGSLSQAYTVPCSSSYTFGVIVGTETFTVETSSLIVKQSHGTCISGIEGWTDASQTQYLFGARFLSTVYLIFQIMPDGPNSIGIAPRSTSQGSSNNNVGAIVGGTIGGVALLALIAFAAIFLYLRQKKQRQATSVYDEPYDAEKPFPNGGIRPFDLHLPTSAQFATSSQSNFGGSSGDGPSTLSPMSSTALVSQQAAALAMQNPDDVDSHGSLDVAPPSYEFSEGIQSPHSPVPLLATAAVASEKSISRVPSEGELSYTSLLRRQQAPNSNPAMSTIAESSAQLGSGLITIYEH
ncbi:aspartic peptidase domain-containing protein [Irpex rosettiformis]|uniref:Aspartic peptidase domain-containing protein n=1 Tax=Irpex rosettiformis TaxID=378272 RepID=A0ACB8U509_9APHY|nr:aspartic peptidase domain-containing protein [Irpex rosettiformis]